MERRDVDGLLPGQRAHRVERERRERHTPHRRRSREVAEDDAQRMLGVEFVVAVGDDEERARPLHTATEIAKQIEGRLISPMRILDDKDRWAGLQLGQHGGEDR